MNKNRRFNKDELREIYLLGSDKSKGRINRLMQYGEDTGRDPYSVVATFYNMKKLMQEIDLNQTYGFRDIVKELKIEMEANKNVL